VQRKAGLDGVEVHPEDALDLAQPFIKSGPGQVGFARGSRLVAAVAQIGLERPDEITAMFGVVGKQRT
jgi:hypothetical protein